MTSEIDAYFEKLDAPMKAVAAELRAAVESQSKVCSVALAWGFPCWKGNERIFSIIAHATHCNLQLWYGAELHKTFPDRIEGTGKALRHVKVRTVSDIDDELTAIIAAAIEMDAVNPRAVR